MLNLLEIDILDNNIAKVRAKPTARLENLPFSSHFEKRFPFRRKLSFLSLSFDWLQQNNKAALDWNQHRRMPINKYFGKFSRGFSKSQSRASVFYFALALLVSGCCR